MKSKIIFIIILILVIGGLGYYIRSDFMSSQPATLNKGESPLGTVGIEQNAKPNIPPPDLNRPINITENLDDAGKKIAAEKIAEISSALKKDPGLFDSWLVLGIYRKQIDDYEGAREIWEYAAALRPGNYIPFNNLGDLYAFYLKDNKKAEENFNKAIELSPNRLHVYYSFHEFYKYVLKDDAKAKALLLKGIAANPGPASEGLQDLLNSL